MSRLRVGVRHWEYEHEYDHGYEENDMFKEMGLDRMVEVDEEVWCEVQAGVDHIVNSTKFSFPRKTDTVLSQAAHRFGITNYRHITIICVPGGYVTGVNYAHLNFKKPPKTERQHRKADKLVYSEVRYRQEGSLNQEDVYTGVNYAHLDFKKPSKTERQHRKADKLVYSEVRYQPDRADHM
ncbi:hypothetical protein MATL_G00128690 [Megalops atlanticus]|uniref:Uncharacterized protein n=1 Tax=Megalops atlanticus TaxID=7932 RepID=A0A9D3PZU5_MEGAT|nr:hypothetical protein MATL_G00128690 [Megalops atlanticus]